MSPGLHRFVSIDMMPMLGGALAALTCALLGNFLVLRRQALMGDAISHAVLPGLVIAFLVTGTRDPVAMLVGAGMSGMATVVLSGLVRRHGRVDPGASMGVVFSVLFALGVLLLEMAAARQVDLDADCVLHGQPEYMSWIPPSRWEEFLRGSTLGLVPRQVWNLVGMCVLTVVFVVSLFKELRIASFDPQLATTQGVSARVMNVLLMALVAGATVAAFEAVGSILVIAMLIGPAVSARLLTDRLVWQVVVSGVLGVGGAIVGYWLAALGPVAIGMRSSVSSAGMMAVMCGVMVGVCLLVAPRHGVVSAWRRRRMLASRILLEDLLVSLAREEAARGSEGWASRASLGRALGGIERSERAITMGERAGLVERTGEGVRLLESGRRMGEGILRAHRRIQSELVEEAGLQADHAHETAEMLEHVMRDRGNGGG